MLQWKKSPYSLGKLIEWKLSLKLNKDIDIIVSLLARETNWMETVQREYQRDCHVYRPYSLGKLIEWKLNISIFGTSVKLSPYSLGKLIEWKLKSMEAEQLIFFGSLLARETNWMETSSHTGWLPSSSRSLLARETNWMETAFQYGTDFSNFCPYSLGKLIEWKPGVVKRFVEYRHGQSLLARETNWMETSWERYYNGYAHSPYSLGKLIEWKPQKICLYNNRYPISPYSLGKLIEWKHLSYLSWLDSV